MENLDFDLDGLINDFDEKVSKFKAQKEEKSQEIYEVNLRYANLYANLVSDVLNNIQEMDSREDVTIKNDLFGHYAIKYNNVFSKSFKSNAVLSEDRLCITLGFFSIERDKLYDEALINQLLQSVNIHISTLESSNPNAPIICTITFYRSKKDLMSLKLNRNK